MELMPIPGISACMGLSFSFQRGTQAGASASSTDAGSPASNCFDGNASTKWLSSGAAVAGSDYVTNDLGTAYQVKRVTVQQAAANSVDHIDILYSDDGSTFTAALSSNVAHTDGSVDTYAVNSGSHRYWRVRDTAACSGPAITGGLRWGIIEIGLYT